MNKMISYHSGLFFGGRLNGFSIFDLGSVSRLTPRVYLITSPTSNLDSLAKDVYLGARIVPGMTAVGKEELCEKALNFAPCARATTFREFSLKFRCGYFVWSAFELALESMKFMLFEMKGFTRAGSTILLGDVFMAKECCLE
jgi:hypothetical protein